MTLQDSSHLFYPPCINACPTMTLCPTMTFLSPLYVFTPIGHLRPLNFVQSSSYFPTLVKSKSDSLLYSFFEKYWSVKIVSQLARAMKIHEVYITADGVVKSKNLPTDLYYDNVKITESRRYKRVETVE